MWYQNYNLQWCTVINAGKTKKGKNLTNNKIELNELKQSYGICLIY